MGALRFALVSCMVMAVVAAGSPAAAAQVTRFPVPGPSQPEEITAGPDGALWFTDAYGRIGRITTAGSVREFTLPDTRPPEGIAAGSDGALWFTQGDAGETRIGRITTAGPISGFPLPIPSSAPQDITRSSRAAAATASVPDLETIACGRVPATIG